MGTRHAGMEGGTREKERQRDREREREREREGKKRHEERRGEKMEESGLAELTISGGFVRMRGGFASVFMGSDGAL